MSYLVLARKWRPKNFDEMVGQTHVTKTLINAIKMDRVAHAFLFAGVRGVGKTSLARILAKALNCEKGPTVEPCEQCESCKAVTAGTAVDVIEIDGASNNSVDDIRDLRETVPYRPALGRFKIYVIDEVHMLSVSAFNALLKTLEEPPPHVKFIFATTEPHKIPVTILSRCQRYDFRRIPFSAIIDRVRAILETEAIEAEQAALALIGREAEGSMRDALSILDQVLASGIDKITAEGVSELLGIADRKVFFDLSEAILSGNPRRCLEIVRDVDQQGYDVPTFSKGLLQHLRNLVVTGVCRGDPVAVDLPDQEAKLLWTQARSVSVNTLHRLFKHFAEAYEMIARSAHPRIMLETALARLADLGDLVSATELIQRLEALESRGPGSGIKAPPRGGNSDRGKRAETKPEPEQVPEPASDHKSQGASSGLSPQEPPVPNAPPLVSAASLNADEQGWNPKMWIDFMEALKGTRPQLASILEYGAPTENSTPGAVEIGFADEYSSVANLAQDRIGEIALFMKELRGQPVQIRIVVDKSIGVPAATRRRIAKEELDRQLDDEARQHPLVRQALAELQGTITQVRAVGAPGESDA